MKNKVRLCPSCGRHYTEAPAISRKDSRIWICPECGIKEALQAAGMMSMFGETLKMYAEARKAYEKASMGS